MSLEGINRWDWTSKSARYICEYAMCRWTDTVILCVYEIATIVIFSLFDDEAANSHKINCFEEETSFFDLCTTLRCVESISL